MDFEYPTRPLADCAKLLSGGTPSKAKPEYWNGDIPWITPKDMADWNGTTADHVTSAAIGNGTRLAPAMASYIAVRGMSLHNEIRVVRPSFPATFNQDIKAIEALAGVNNRFLFYCLLAHKPTLLEKVESAGHGTGRLPTDQLERLPIPDVHDDIAAAIAKVLGDLDDKIDVLREMSRTLEEIARAVFRAWFVDFEPVRAKAAGATSFCGMPQDLFDALPDRFDQSELGEIPRGWSQCVLVDLVDVNPNRPLRKGALSAYLGMSDVPTDGPTAETWGEREFTSGTRFKNGDTLLARITPCLENGKTALVDFLGGEEIGWGSTEFIVLAPKATTPAEFIYCLARNERFREFAIKNMTGTSGRQRVDHTSISGYRMVDPGSLLLEGYGRIAKPIFERISADRDEIAVLSALRDALLPKLISGELQAPSIETLGVKAVSDGG